VAGAFAVFLQLLRKSRWPRAAGLLWLAGALAVYLLLVLTSNFLHLFVVTGRFANQMVPFLCLTAASGLAHLAHASNASKKFVLLIAGAITLQAACNFAQSFRLYFPYEVRQQARAQYGEVTDDVTVYCTLWRMNAEGVAFVLEEYQTDKGGGDAQRSRYVLLNGGVPFLPIKGPKGAPKGEVLFKVPHMMTYAPYHYQAFKPKERAILRSTDISMRLIDTSIER
jgi:hypothetical protein